MRYGLLLLFTLTLVSCEPQPVSVAPVTAGTRCDVLRVQFKLNGVTSHGGGALVHVGGRDVLLTALHLRDEGAVLHLLDAREAPVPFTPVRFTAFPECDVLAVEVTGVPAHVKRWPVAEVSTGEVVASGYPEGGALTDKRGAVQSVAVQTTAHIESGMSGCPLLQRGRIVGVTTAYTNASTGRGGSHADVGYVLRLLRGR